MKQLALDLAHSPPPTLRNFVAGRNAELLDNLRRIFSGGAGERFIYLWGERRSGRSHLLRGAVEAAEAAGSHAVYIACTDRAAIAGDLDAIACAAVDDVENLDATGQVALFSLYNALRERQGALIASGDAPPAQLKLRPDLVTRLGWGLVYQVHGLSDEEKAQALDRHARARGFALPAEVSAYLLTHAQRDMTTLLGMVDALDRHSLEAKCGITVGLARDLLQAAAAPDPAPGKTGAGL